MVAYRTVLTLFLAVAFAPAATGLQIQVPAFQVQVDTGPFADLELTEPVPAGLVRARPTAPIQVRVSGFTAELSERSSDASFSEVSFEVDPFEMVGSIIVGLSREFDYTVSVPGFTRRIPAGVGNYSIRTDGTVRLDSNSVLTLPGKVTFETPIGPVTVLAGVASLRWFLLMEDRAEPGAAASFLVQARFQSSFQKSFTGTDPETGGPMVLRVASPGGMIGASREFAVPEPSTAVLFVTGLGMTAALRRRQIGPGTASRKRP